MCRRQRGSRGLGSLEGRRHPVDTCRGSNWGRSQSPSRRRHCSGRHRRWAAGNLARSPVRGAPAACSKSASPAADYKPDRISIRRPECTYDVLHNEVDRLSIIRHECVCDADDAVAFAGRDSDRHYRDKKQTDDGSKAHFCWNRPGKFLE